MAVRPSPYWNLHESERQRGKRRPARPRSRRQSVCRCFSQYRKRHCAMVQHGGFRIFPPQGQYGTTSRGQYRNPGYSDVDFSVFKDTHFSEKITLQLTGGRCSTCSTASNLAPVSAFPCNGRRAGSDWLYYRCILCSAGDWTLGILVQHPTCREDYLLRLRMNPRTGDYEI